MAVALTTSQGNGRLIQMVNSGNANVNAVRLNHESYRDGIIGSAQTEETVSAVIAHTMMAAKMAMYGADFSGDENIMRDLYELSKGNMSAFTEYAMANYDSSADYWRLTADGGLEYDGSGWLKGVDGKYILDDNGNKVGAETIETGLIKILGLDPNKAEDVSKVQDMMVAAGLKYRIKEGGDAEDRNSWYWDGSVAEDNAKITIGQNLLAPMGMIHLPAKNYTPVERSIASYAKSLAITATTPIDVQPGYPMVDEIRAGTAAVPGATNHTWCNKVSYNTDVALLGVEMANRLVKEEGIGYTNANSMGSILAKGFTSVEGWKVQDAANKGEVGKVSYINPNSGESGHIATVVASYGTFIPALGPRVAQGGSSNGEMWAKKGFGSALGTSNNYIISQKILRTDDIRRQMTQHPMRAYAAARKAREQRGVLK
jgi:hypothetical protein